MIEKYDLDQPAKSFVQNQKKNLNLVQNNTCKIGI